jgi:hypothetical protein
MSTRVRFAVLASVILATACAKADAPATQTPTKSKAQRDSAVGRSGLPGSQGVMKALGAADSARKRQAAIDSAGIP